MIAELMVESVVGIISATGLAGIFILMLLESTVFPLPSELVMPFAGFLIVEGRMQFVAVVVAATLGSIAGSTISYFIGKKLGKQAIINYGKYFLLEKKHLDTAHKWFERHGAKAVFACRFVPAIRHVISIPAGIAEMNFPKFIACTAIGALCWNAFLAWFGIQLGKNWIEIVKYSSILDVAIVILAILAVILYLKKKPKKSHV